MGLRTGNRKRMWGLRIGNRKMLNSKEMKVWSGLDNCVQLFQILSWHPCLILGYYWIHTGKIYRNILYCLWHMMHYFSEDPVRIAAAVETTPTLVDTDGVNNEKEANTTPPIICECSECPSLDLEEFSRCCQSTLKTRELCIKLEISCICQSPKLDKYFDKAQ